MFMKEIEAPAWMSSCALGRDLRTWLRGLKRMQRGNQNVDSDTAVSPSLERLQ